jgi:hypothetical protein
MGREEEVAPGTWKGHLAEWTGHRRVQGFPRSHRRVGKEAPKTLVADRRHQQDVLRLKTEGKEVEQAWVSTGDTDESAVVSRTQAILS